MSPSCLFCRIVAGEIPATIVREDDHCVAFRDINPQAPVHVLVIPRGHVDSLDTLADDMVGARVLAMAREVARQEGIATTGYRTVFNTNAAAGQTVFHLHAHVLGGRALDWPPG
ncbi:MAG: histidine triad nucleotide-binding protein [Gemmatimonadetes bacterium]|nr:histidine triad nucleotide-binding protein [Gemmatimonadota bacterium]